MKCPVLWASHPIITALMKACKVCTGELWEHGSLDIYVKKWQEVMNHLCRLWDRAVET